MAETKKKTSKAKKKVAAFKKKVKKERAKKKASKKVAKKAKKAPGVKKKVKKVPISKNVYVVEEFGDGHRVHKIKSESSKDEAEVYIIDPNGVCDCKASDFGTDCKHVAMVNGSLSHGSFNRAHAGELLETYLEEVLRPQFPRARLVNLVEYKKDTSVGNAAALACGVLSDRSVEKLTIWTVYEKLLIRIHCFKDLKRYRRALSFVRRKAAGIDEEQPPVDVGAVGQTYGNKGEDA